MSELLTEKINRYTGEYIPLPWEIRERQKHRPRHGKGDTYGIKYGYIRNGKYYVDSAYCWKCDFQNPLNGQFPSICSACPNCGNKQCRWNSPKRALALRHLFENAIREDRRKYRNALTRELQHENYNIQWCNPT